MVPEIFGDWAQKLGFSIAIGIILVQCALSYCAMRNRRSVRRERRHSKCVLSRRPNIKHYTSRPCDCAPRSLSNLPQLSNNVKKKHFQHRYHHFHHSCYHHNCGAKGVVEEMMMRGGTTAHGHMMPKVLLTRNIPVVHLNALLGRNGSSSSGGGKPAWCFHDANDSCAQHVVGNLLLTIDELYKPESAFYRFPVELKCFVHEDSSRLTLVAEDLSSVGGGMKTETYKNLCIQQTVQLAKRHKTYFKIRHDTPASSVVTSIMKRFLNIIIGIPQMNVISFLLVQDHFAYTIQLHTRQDLYEMHLDNLLYIVQGARIGEVMSSSPLPFQSHALRVGIGKEAYMVHTPLQFITTRTPDNNLILLRHRHACEWSGEVLGQASGVAAENQGNNDDKSDGNNGFINATAMKRRSLMTLIPNKVYLISYWHRHKSVDADVVKEVEQLLLEVRASAIKQGPDGDLPPSRYVSEKLEMPLPPITLFATNVCSHIADAFINLFLRSKFGEVFEIEVGALSLGEKGNFAEFFSLLFSSLGESGTTPAGKAMVSFLGETENGMKLRIDAVKSTKAGLWCVVKCLHAINYEVPTELLRYVQSVLDEVSLSTSWHNSCPWLCSN